MPNRSRPTYQLVSTNGARPSQALLDEIAARAGLRRGQLAFGLRRQPGRSGRVLTALRRARLASRRGGKQYR